jgi:hypothetical protein
MHYTGKRRGRKYNPQHTGTFSIQQPSIKAFGSNRRTLDSAPNTEQAAIIDEVKIWTVKEGRTVTRKLNCCNCYKGAAPHIEQSATL